MKRIRTIPLFFAFSIVLVSFQTNSEENHEATQKQIVAVFNAEHFVQNSCADISTMQSFKGDATTIYFQNETGKNLRIYWINYSGDRVVYQDSLEPGKGRMQHTFLTHPWYIVTADEKEECITIVTALRPAVRDTVYFRWQFPQSRRLPGRGERLIRRLLKTFLPTRFIN
ncbi:VHL beta domain-containing protein [Limnospira fusiformis]|uniref:VHL beta domain-containing protein n=1 Tax=Limnospira fusiformis TaxID=54297 RepID=UPI0014495148|nr:hypothetical protein HFV01_04510 [Limnospira fusiformis SAG 85.79]